MLYTLYMKTTYGSFLKYIREEGALSQAEVANKAKMSRASYVAVEKGTKELSLAEAVALTELFGITINELMQSQAPNVPKYRHLILAFLRTAKNDRLTIKKTKLSRLLYLADFSWYYLNDTSLSNVAYRHTEFGAVSDTYFRLLEEMEQSGIISVKQIYRDDYHMYEIEETRASQKTKLNTITTKELTHLERIWNQWKDASTAEIIKFTNEQKPYLESVPGEIIDYNLIKGEEAHTVY